MQRTIVIAAAIGFLLAVIRGFVAVLLFSPRGRQFLLNRSSARS
jgi:hypothetical protein